MASALARQLFGDVQIALFFRRLDSMRVQAARYGCAVLAEQLPTHGETSPDQRSSLLGKPRPRYALPIVRGRRP